MGDHSEVATLAGGCFWCLEAVFERLTGVERVESGYAGGDLPNPSYQQICTGKTGHAEVVQITFNPEIITYRELLEVFFGVHNPTTLNRQGPDVGTQYRSAVFYHSTEQKAVLEQVIGELEDTGTWYETIVTEIAAFTAFYPAEEYHQQYYQRNPDQPYCQVIIAPKVAQFHEKYTANLGTSQHLSGQSEP